MNNLKKYFLTFIVFAICGWLYEEFLFIVEDHVLVNRGSLWGPWLPIYGFGGFAVILLFYRYKDKKIMIGNVNIRPLVLFVETTIICVLVELISTYIIDFRSLWDYSDKFMNFEGRIALVPGLRFGILALLGIYYVYPLCLKLANVKNKKVNFLYYVIFVSCLLLQFSNYIVFIPKYYSFHIFLGFPTYVNKF